MQINYLMLYICRVNTNTMFKKIFNAKGITESLKKDHGPNTYHRFNNALNGNVRGMTVEMVSEIEETIKRDTKKMLDYLNKMKKDVANLNESKQAA